MRGREYMVSLKPCGRGIVLETPRYADEVNKAQNYFRDIDDAEPDEELLDLAMALIERKTARFDPGKFHDRYIEALEDLIERKRKGKTIHTEEEETKPERGMNVVDLMAALKRSIEKPGEKAPAGKTAAKKAPAKKAAAKKAPARKTAARAAPARKRA
jgi:DNA end-binding protein Ku